MNFFLQFTTVVAGVTRNIPATPRAFVRKNGALRTRAGALFDAAAGRDASSGVLTYGAVAVVSSSSSPNVCRTVLPRHVGPPWVSAHGLFCVRKGRMTNLAFEAAAARA